MGRYSVPEEMRERRPDGTAVKKTDGHLHACEKRKEKGTDGRWRTASGSCIGRIDDERGHLPNDRALRSQERGTPGFGQWAVADDLSRETYALPGEFLDADDADRIHVTALCHFVEGPAYTKKVSSPCDMSVLRLRYPGPGLGYDALATPCDDLGRRDGPAPELQRTLSERCSGMVAIDGHVVGSGSRRNDLASKGHEFRKLGEPQVNLLMALDAQTGRPICSRSCEGRATDRIVVRDLIRQVPFSGVIFLVDRGLDGDENEALLAQGGNDYVFPPDGNDARCREATSSLDDLKDQFVWQRGGKTTLVQYKEHETGGRRVIACRDLPGHEEEKRNHRRHIDAGDSGYTAEKLAEKAPYLGVYVLQTSLSKETRSAEEVFGLHEDRWTVETYFDYFKNGQDGHTLCQQSHCRQQGLAFVMLVAGLIECEVRAKVAKSGVGMSVADVLRDARALKADSHGGGWVINNCPRKREARMRRLGVAMEAAPSRAA